MYFVELNFDILMNIVNKISNIFTHLTISLEYNLKLRTSWSLVFRMLLLQVNLNFDLLKFKESLIFQVFNLSEVVDLEQTCTSWKLVEIWIFNSSELQYFRASILPLTKDPLNEWQMSLFTEKFHGLYVGLDPFSCWAWTWAHLLVGIELGLVFLLGLSLDFGSFF